MSSPFFGLDIGITGLHAAQQQLDTAAHNVANANTPGYSRQRVTVVASPPYTFPAFNKSGLPGQIGTGVSITMISRVRDTFLDTQIQQQSSLQGEWQARSDELAKVESVFPEPGSSGLGSTISKFWDAWQDVAADPTSTAARSALTEQAAAMAEEINRDAGQLASLASGIDYQVNQQTSQVNDLARQIAGLNRQIQAVTVSGDHANDLDDQRDQLLSQLSQIVPVTVKVESDGTATVLLGGTDLVSGVRSRSLVAPADASGHAQPAWADGSTLVLPGGQLQALVQTRDGELAGYRSQLDGLARGLADATNAIHQAGVDMTGAAGLPLFTYSPANPAATLAINQTIAADPRRIATAATADALGDGSVAGLIADLRNARSYASGTPGTDVTSGSSLTSDASGTTVATLRTIAAGTAKAQTYTFSVDNGSIPPKLVLTGADGSSQAIAVPDMAAGSQQVLNFDQLGIALTVSTASTTPETGANIMAALTAVGHDSLPVSSLFTPPQTAADFYAGLVGKIGADSGQAAEMAKNQELVVNHLTQRMQQVSGVSLDEEATDMIRFQHAYQAAARVITTMDEVLDTLINRTGRVGL